MRPLARPALFLLCLAAWIGSVASALAAPALRTVSLQVVSESCSAGSPRLGDGNVDPGETVDLQLVVRNIGDATATGITGVMITATPGVALLRDALNYADIPAGATATAIVPAQIAVESTVDCGTVITFTVALRWTGGFRQEPQNITIPVDCFPCGVDPCDPRTLTPFNATGPYGTTVYQTAEDFTLPTLTGDWNLQANWSGCDQLVFFVRKHGSFDDWYGWSGATWASSLGDLLNRSPRNTHWFFLSDAPDDATALADANGMQARIDATVGALPAADRLHWQSRLHAVPTRVALLDNWIETHDDVVDAGRREPPDRNGDGFPDWWVPSAFMIDSFQKIRQVAGYLFPLGINQNPTLGWIAHEVRALNFERERQRALDAETFLEIPIWSGELIGGGVHDVVLPPPEVLAKYDTMLFDLQYLCQSTYNSASCEWDYNHRLYICDPADTAGCRATEIGRWITPYGRGGRWVTDFTPSLAHLIQAGGGAQRFYYEPGYAYYTTFRILLSNRNKGARPHDAEYLYGGGNFRLEYNPARPPKDVYVPGWADEVRIGAFITGHGFGNAILDNCAEFCNHEHRFSLNGDEHWKRHPEAQSNYGCIDQIETGTLGNQYGTWQFGRGGWCPGADVPYFIADVTSASFEGWNTAWYQAFHRGIPYDPGCDGPGQPGCGFHPRLDVSSHVFYYVEPAEMDCTDGLDDDRDGFADCEDRGCMIDPACAGLDADGDWMPDSRDNCPVTSNGRQEDADGDGVGDACDNCPLVPNLAQADADRDGVGDACEAADRDGDGVLDGTDNCVAVANADQANSDTDAFGDACDNCPSLRNADQRASDPDPYGDACDNCPLTDNDGQEDADGDGVGDACEGLDRDGDTVLDGVDNCVDVANPSQEDADGNGTGDACECRPGDEPASGPGASLRVTAGATLAWDAVANAATHPVYRGTIPPGATMGTRVPAHDHACVAEPVTTTWIDADPVAAGGFYYLVSAKNDCGEAANGVDSDSRGTPRPQPGCP